MDWIWELDTNDVLTISIAFLALLVSLAGGIVNWVFNKKTDKKAEQAIRLAQGATEIELRNLISNARREVTDFRLKIKEFKKENPEDDLGDHEKVFYAILEDYFNQYDRACRLYLDDKVDKHSFKKEYKKEIENLIKNPNYKRYLNPKKKRYEGIILVCQEWFEGKLLFDQKPKKTKKLKPSKKNK